jgi:microcystin degradation protein MlrC
LDKTPLYPFLSPREAIRTAATHGGKPVVVTDTGDIVPGDSTILLEDMLNQEIDCDALITMVDPEAAKKCAEAGVGKNVRMNLGAKKETLFSKPLNVEGKIRTLFDGKFNGRDSGLTAVLQIRKIKVVISEFRGSDYRSVGLEPKDVQIWVVKAARGLLSPNLEYTQTASKTVFAGTPGYTMSDVTKLPFKNLPRPFYPFDEEEEKFQNIRKMLGI